MYGLLAPVEKLLNRYLTDTYAKKHLQPKTTLNITSPQTLSEV